MKVAVPEVLGKSFVDETEASLCLVAKKTAFGLAKCPHFRVESVPGIPSFRCALIGGEEFAAQFCPRAVEVEVASAQ